MKRRVVEIRVSDHAVLRWLERQHGLDVDAIKRAMAGMVLNGAELGALAVAIDRTRLVLADRKESGQATMVVVTTALSRDSVLRPNKRRARHG